MKASIYFCIVFILVGCEGRQAEKNLAGVYTGYHEHEFGKTSDTLIVSVANGGNGMYDITRHSGVARIEDGTVYPKMLMIEKYTAKYNRQYETLDELREGKVFIWNSRKEILILGETEYKKIR